MVFGGIASRWWKRHTEQWCRGSKHWRHHPKVKSYKFYLPETEVLHLSRKPVQSSLQVGAVKLKQVEKFKYLRVAFTSDGTHDKEMTSESANKVL